MRTETGVWRRNLSCARRLLCPLFKKDRTRAESASLPFGSKKVALRLVYNLLSLRSYLLWAWCPPTNATPPFPGGIGSRRAVGERGMVTPARPRQTFLPPASSYRVDRSTGVRAQQRR